MPREHWQDRLDPTWRDVENRRSAEGSDRRLPEPRSWMERAGELLSGHLRGPGIETRPPRPRRSLSDLVLGAEIAERLEDVSDLDLRDVDVVVLDGEVTLTGAVRSKLDRRRIENVADIDGVRHVQNNLRVRSRSHWTFL